MASVVLLSTTYLGPIQYFTKFFLKRKLYIEVHETFQKQTYRNRCNILTANGPISLVVPVQKGSFHKVPVNKLEIDYTRKWQSNHWRAIEAAYSAAPYFEFYKDGLRSYFENKTQFLINLNIGLMKKIFELVGFVPSFSFTEHFITLEESSIMNDFRLTIRPKHPIEDPHFKFLPYHQVFEDRHGFVPNLSILDLLFNLGPDTITYLKDCIIIKPN